MRVNQSCQSSPQLLSAWAVLSLSPAAGGTHLEKTRDPFSPHEGSFCLCNQPQNVPGAYSDCKGGRGEVVNLGLRVETELEGEEFM